MSHLVDTHVLLWMLTAPERLSEPVRRLVADRSSRISVSAVSAWEVAVKHRLGKLPQADVLVGGWHRHLDRLGVDRLSITDEHALLAGRLSWSHRDPFDRMLAAQAMTESLVLVTGDAAFTDLAGVRTLW